MFDLTAYLSFGFSLTLIFLPNNNFSEFVKLKISDPSLSKIFFSSFLIISIIFSINKSASGVRMIRSDLLSNGLILLINSFCSSLDIFKRATDLSIDEFIH